MENQATMSDFDSILASRGVTRRSFMKLCAGIAAAAGLSQLAVPRVAQALEESVTARRPATCIRSSGSRVLPAPVARSPSPRWRLPMSHRSCST